MVLQRSFCVFPSIVRSVAFDQPMRLDCVFSHARERNRWDPETCRHPQTADPGVFALAGS
jgi:hypothetical protein